MSVNSPEVEREIREMVNTPGPVPKEEEVVPNITEIEFCLFCGTAYPKTEKKCPVCGMATRNLSHKTLDPIEYPEGKTFDDLWGIEDY